MTESECVPGLVVSGDLDPIAHALVRLACDRGWRVALIVAHDEHVEVAEEVTVLRADGTNADEIEATFSAVTTLWQSAPDALVYSAHTSRTRAAVTESSTGWETVQSQHLRAAFLFAQAGAREMLRLRGGTSVDDGSVVFISDVSAIRGANGHSSVSMNAAVAGLEGVTRQLAAEWGPYGIRVNMLHAGTVDGTPGLPPELMHRVPLGRSGRPEELAESCYYLISRSSSYVTGIVLPVDGGFLAT